MPRNLSKTRSAPKKGQTAPPPSSADVPDVMTAAEAAAYLRVPEQAILHALGPNGLPGRLIGGEWRILKSALEEWLRTTPKLSSREALFSVAGAAKDDPYLDEMLEEIYRRRGRPMTETAE